VEEKTSTFVDRSGWDSGQWDDEPDRIEWRDTRATPILPCLIVRNGGGALCGYVGVPPGHPWHGRDYSYDGGNNPVNDIRVHGGVTYASKCQEDGHICHFAQPGEADDVWWIGFDCSHSGDYRPRDSMLNRKYGWCSHGETYKNVGYVRVEIELLVNQARSAAKGGE
jgi:hypothetical protein